MYGVTTQNTGIHIFTVQKKTEFHVTNMFTSRHCMPRLQSSWMWRHVGR